MFGMRRREFITARNRGATDIREKYPKEKSEAA
jgi:hypothetical protein